MSDEAREKITKLVDVEFSEKVLRQSENDPSIKVTDMAIKPATNKGDNYTSDMFRATIEYEAAGGERLKKSIIVKVEPMAEGIHKDLVRLGGLLSLFSSVRMKAKIFQRILLIAYRRLRDFLFQRKLITKLMRRVCRLYFYIPVGLR